MKLKIIGTLDIIRPVEHLGKFRKCEFSVYDEKNRYYGMQANNIDAYWLTDYKKGDKVEIDFELKGKPYGSKVFNNLIVEKITMVENTGTTDYQEMMEQRKEVSRNKPKITKVNVHEKE